MTSDVDRDGRSGIQQHPSKRALSREEAIAVQALQRYAPDATRINVWKEVPGFLGGTAIFVEYWIQERDRTEPVHYDSCVLVKRSGATVYEKWPDVLNILADYNPGWLNQLSAPQFVIALVTLAILGTSCYMFIKTGGVPQPFEAALAGVIGYWLGQTKLSQQA